LAPGPLYQRILTGIYAEKSCDSPFVLDRFGRKVDTGLMEMIEFENSMLTASGVESDVQNERSRHG
jgi:hypothetical protein